MSASQHFVFLLVENFSHIAFSCAIEPLRIANLLSGEELYQWSLVSENGETASCSNGTVTLVDHGFDAIPANDRIYILSGIDVQHQGSAALKRCLRQQQRMRSPMGALCSAAYLLAELGCLDGRKAAIHWEFHDSFMEQFPEVNLVRNVFVADEPIITASGGTATADLMLNLISDQHSAELATAVADQMVYYSVRDASVDQLVGLHSRQVGRNPHLNKAIQKMMDSIEAPVSTTTIADDIGISKRQLERLFGRYLNCSPKRYFLEMRVNRARNLIMQTEMSVTQVAVACGFESIQHFSKVYKAAFGIAPSKHQSSLL
ncbi:MAG: GlxA family transcriptional regulator [Granulosicoccaceae bacterium]